MSKPRLLWHSNTPLASTGYAQQTALFTKRLKEHYQLVISAFYGIEGYSMSWEGIPILPGIGQTYGNETIREHVDALWGGDLRNGLVVSLMDVWVLDPALWRQFNLACWVPVDHEPAPAPVSNFFANSGAVPIAMSRFGQEQLDRYDPLYVPHGVDTALYKPHDKAESRKAFGLPDDCFLVGMVAANKGNPSRKCFSEAFQAFKALHARHPEARLYLHTEMTGRFQGVNLPQLIRAVGIPLEAVSFADQYRMSHLPFPAEKMAQVYSSMDVLLAASAGEGFGIPVIEAQACGVPVIVSDFSAQPELVGAGWKVEGQRNFTPIGSWQFTPSVEDIAEALESAYRLKGRPDIAERARAKAMEYDADHVLTEYMLPALETAWERFDERSPRTLEAVAA